MDFINKNIVLLLIAAVVFVFGGGNSESIAIQKQNIKIIDQLDNLNQQFNYADKKIMNFERNVDYLSKEIKILKSQQAVVTEATKVENIEEQLENNHDISKIPDATMPNKFLGAINTGETTISVSPTAEQNKIFYNLKNRLDDPAFTQNLNIQEFLNMEEVKQIPQVLQYVLISKIIQKTKNGDILNKNIFTVPN